MIERGPDLPEPERGHLEPTTWGAIEFGHIVRDKMGRLHTVTDTMPGHVKLESSHGFPDVVMKRPADDREVDIYVPSEQECLNLLDRELGARILRDIEEREHTLARASRFRYDPIPRNAVALRDHLDMAHAVYVEELLYRATVKTTSKMSNVKAEFAARRKAALEELVELHDELHADPHTQPMAIPHHHAHPEES